MRARLQFSLFVATLVLLLVAGVAVAAQDPGLVVRSAVFSGGEPVAAGDFVLDSTLGEPVAGDLSEVDGTVFASGYWPSAHRHGNEYLPVIAGGD
jgi:hypothetical protein